MELSKRLLSGTIRTGVLIGAAALYIAIGSGIYYFSKTTKNTQIRLDKKSEVLSNYNNNYSSR